MARFVDTRTLRVNGRDYSADHIVIATGGAPIVPPVAGADLGITSDGFFELEAQPRRVAIVGGGYIGVELAGVLNALGSEVTLVALEDRLLSTFDALPGEVLLDSMRRHDVDVRLGFEVSGLEGQPGRIDLRAADGRRLRGFDTVIWAVGRRPRTTGPESPWLPVGSSRSTSSRTRPGRASMPSATSPGVRR